MADFAAWAVDLWEQALILLVGSYAAISLVWLAWRWDRPLTTPRKRKPRRS